VNSPTPSRVLFCRKKHLFFFYGTITLPEGEKKTRERKTLPNFTRDFQYNNVCVGKKVENITKITWKARAMHME